MNRRGGVPAFLIDVGMVLCALALILALTFSGPSLLVLVCTAVFLVSLLLPSFFPRFPAFVPVRARWRRPATRAPPLF